MGIALNDYRRALDILFARTTGESKLGLERTTALLAALGDPHRALRTLHIAGTNGKGSVAASLVAILRAGGHRVGAYSSPHLLDFRERIVVDQTPMAPEAITEFIERWLATIEAVGATFFEATTAMAFDYFARIGVDAAVIETGLGGRLDATNVIHPLCAAVTSIALDHTEQLGDTRERIAAEKAGIFKAGVPAVIGEQEPAIRALLAGFALDAGASVIRTVGDDVRITDIHVSSEGTTFTLARGDQSQRISTPLVGRHQAWNAAVALLMHELSGDRFALPRAVAARALGAVTLAGRFERVGKFILDVAHNAGGVEALVETLGVITPPRPLVAVVCVLADKDWRAMIGALAPAVDGFVFTQAPTAPASRAWNPDTAGAFAAAHGWNAIVQPDLDAALAHADAVGATVLVTGSFHTVGDALARLQPAPLAR